MKLSKLLILLLAGAFMFADVAAQNISLNILTHKSGLVNTGDSVFLEITINNSDQVKAVPAYKLRPQISVPASIASIPATGHILPPGWAITFNKAGVIRLSNGTDEVPPNTARTILLQLRGVAPGGPSTISGNLLFSNGVSPGSAVGTSTQGDNPADNSSTTTCEVSG